MTRTYTIVLDPYADEGGYTVLVPSLPGCITQGGSVEECLERAREAIALHIAAWLTTASLFRRNRSILNF